jgi:hypothetical protein
MRDRLNSLDTPGGHLLLSFAVFVVGVILVLVGQGYGQEVARGGLVALGVSMRAVGDK